MISARLFKKHASALARATLAPIPLAFWESAFPKDMIALCYHVVSDADLPHLQLYPYKNASQFEADVTFARDRALTYRQVVDGRVDGAHLPRNGILFTFDDGLMQCYDVIRPILKRHGVDGVFFVTTDYLDDRETFFECALSLCLARIAALDEARAAEVLAHVSNTIPKIRFDAMRFGLAKGRMEATRLNVGDGGARRELLAHVFGLEERDVALPLLCELLHVDPQTYAARTPIFMSSDAVRSLVADGFTIGAHGRKHRTLENLSLQELECEMVASCEAVRAITGQSRVPFAFPYSGLAIDRVVLADIVRRNPIVELIFDSGCLRRDPDFIVNRVFTDAPAAVATERSNVPTVLREAWSIPSAWFRS